MQNSGNLASPRPEPVGSALDRLDLSLLALLQESSDFTNQQLSERLPLSSSQCSRRRDRLRDIGIIERDAAIVDPKALGLNVKAFVLVTLSEQAGRALEFHEFVGSTSEVLECSIISGMANFILKLHAPDVKRLRELVLKMCDIRLVQNVKVSVVLNEQKRTTALPLMWAIES
jgi:Lrp/AsnC family transcriptional regulator, leucine-responsive regulatory protein